MKTPEGTSLPHRGRQNIPPVSFKVLGMDMPLVIPQALICSFKHTGVDVQYKHSISSYLSLGEGCSATFSAYFMF